MVSKLKSISDNNIRSTVKDSAQQIWLAGLGAFMKAQQEGYKMFDALVKDGLSIQKKTKAVADEKIEMVAGKASGTWDRLELVFEDRVARALGSLGVPNKKDIDKLNKRVADLTASVQKLSGGKAPAAAPKAAAKRPTAKKAATKKAPSKAAAKKAPASK